MYCTKCGHQVSLHANYCGSCGEAFNNKLSEKDETNDSRDQMALGTVKWWNFLANLFKGRLGRLDYFLLTWVSFVVFFLGIGILLEIIPGAESFLGSLAVVVFVALVVLGLSGSIRRLHDMGSSGWVILIGFIPLIGFIFSLVLLFSVGTEGANKYGEQGDSRGFFGRILNL